MKDKEWLKEEIGKNIISDTFSRLELNMDMDELECLIDQLDEPEITEEQAWNKITESYPADAKSLSVAFEHFYYEGFSKKELPIIPQFVADWIEDYRDHGGVIVDMLGSLTTELDSVSSVDNEVAQWFRENTKKMLKALMDDYEVEKEKKYRVRAGNRYVRFNLDGSIIGAKKDNSIVCLERLSKLPFDYKKAVDSGIITLEEVTE